MVQILLAIEDRIPGVSVNFPPEWITTPNPPVFFEGSPGDTFSLLPYAFDPDADPLFFSDTGIGFEVISFDDDSFDADAFDFSEGLPEGVSIVGSDLVIDAGAPSSTTSVQVYVSDGINAPVLSGSFTITITPFDIAPVIDTTPNPTFTGGVASTYDFNTDITDDAVSPLTFSLSGTLGPGLSLNSSTGILSYNGSGVSSNSHILTVSDAVGQAISNVFVINTTLSDTPDYNDPVAGITLLGGRNIVSVSSDAQLTSALSAATAGDTIQLDPGTYAGTYTLEATSTGNNPVIVKGADNFASVFTGQFRLGGAKNIVTGLMFNGENANLQIYGDNCKFIGNKMTGRKGNMIGPKESDPGSHCEIAYNEFYSPGAWNGTYPPTEFRMAVRFTTGGNGQWATVHQDGWLHHNYVHDFPQKPDPTNYHSGQSDAFELGEAAYDWNQNKWNWYVEDNVIQRHLQSGQSSIIDIKAAGVVCRRNTALDSQNIRIDNRLGGQCIIESNWCGSIHVHSIDNIIVGNRVTGNIALTAGDTTYNGTQAGSTTHQQCVDTLVTGNIGLLDVGRYFGQGDQTFPALNTIIEAHTGGVQLTGSSGEVDNRNVFPSSRNFIPAVQGSVSDVGPDAIANASAAYKAARGLDELDYQWLKGVGAFNPTIDVQPWIDWMGFEMEAVSCWIGQSSPMNGTWAELKASALSNPNPAWNFAKTMEVFGGNTGTESRRTIPIICSWPMVPANISNRRGQRTATWTEFAAGDFDQHWLEIAQNLQTNLVNHDRTSNGDSLILRLGWEMNGEWYPWGIAGSNATESENNLQNYWESWTRVTNIMKTVMPGLRFEWSPAMPRGGFYWDGSRNYSATGSPTPGDGLSMANTIPPENVTVQSGGLLSAESLPSNIDFITRSTHDAHPFTTNLGTGSGSFQRIHIDPYGEAGTKEFGLQELVDLAAARGIQWGISEWGTQMSDCTSPNCNESVNFCTSSNPDVFIEGVYNFLSANQARLAYDTYFEISCTRLRSRPTTAAAIEYQTSWSS
jgi:hypothetical protein